jgi:hypothetical protein
MERRLDRLEAKISPTSCEGWCCASEADAKDLIARLRSKGSSPPLLFIAGQSNSGGSTCWRIEGKSVAELWRAIDRFSPEPPRVEPASPEVDTRAAEQLTDEQLLGVIADGGSMLVLWPNGDYRLLERGAQL